MTLVETAVGKMTFSQILNKAKHWHGQLNCETFMFVLILQPNATNVW